MNLKYILVVWLFILLGSEICAQKHLYSVHRGGGKEIGEITASLTEYLHTQTYEILSSVSFRILWKRYHRTTNNLVVYAGGSMETSYSRVYMNNDLEDSTAINQEHNNYHVFQYPHKSYILYSTDLRFSTAKLYFQEPEGIQEVYSERFLQYCRLEAQEDHRYKLYLPDGKVNYYTYEDNELVKVVIERTWFNLEFRKK